jgi:hypothetical protein
MDRTKFAACTTMSFVAFVHILLVLFSSCIYGYMFSMLLFSFVNYIFLLLCVCILIVMLFLLLCFLIVIYVPFWVFCFIWLFCVLCVCVYMCTVLLPSGGNPIAVNRYIISINNKLT